MVGVVTQRCSAQWRRRSPAISRRFGKRWAIVLMALLAGHHEVIGRDKGVDYEDGSWGTVAGPQGLGLAFRGHYAVSR